MTKREKLNYFMETYGNDEIVSEYVAHEVELLDNKAKSNEKRKAKKAEENAHIENEILEVFKDNVEVPITVTEIESELDGKYTKQKLTPRVNALVEKGFVERNTYRRQPIFTMHK